VKYEEMNWGHSQGIPSALFLDFDNVFRDLYEMDEDLAFKFAQEPSKWMGRLANLEAHIQPRDFLIRKCFMDPQGKVKSKHRKHSNGTDLTRYFSSFRQYFVESGFEVIDCPPLRKHRGDTTKDHIYQGFVDQLLRDGDDDAARRIRMALLQDERPKNAADIVIALQIVDALDHPSYIANFSILTSDTDFTPVLRRVREYGRNTLLVSTSQTGTVLRSLSHIFVGLQDLMDIATDPVEARSGGLTELELEVSGASNPGINQEIGDDIYQRNEAAAKIREMVRNSLDPVLLADIGIALRQFFGDERVTLSKWFGAVQMKNLIQSDATVELEFSQHHVWDKNRHDTPTHRSDFLVPEFIESLCQNIDLPKLSQMVYIAIFAEIQRLNDLGTQSDLAAEVREALKLQNYLVGKKQIQKILIWVKYGGAILDGTSRPTHNELAEYFFNNCKVLANLKGIELSREGIEELRTWIGLSN
jgi:hypothetical protein